MILILTKKETKTLETIQKLEDILETEVVDLICDTEKSMGDHSKTRYRGFRTEIDNLTDAVERRKNELKEDFYKNAMDRALKERNKEQNNDQEKVDN